MVNSTSPISNYIIDIPLLNKEYIQNIFKIFIYRKHKMYIIWINFDKIAV